MTPTTKLATRSERALQLANTSGAIRQNPDGTFNVESLAHPGQGYAVDAVAGTCTCMDFLKRGVACKHLLAVQESEYRKGGKFAVRVGPEGQVRAWRRIEVEPPMSIQRIVEELWGPDPLDWRCQDGDQAKDHSDLVLSEVEVTVD